MYPDPLIRQYVYEQEGWKRLLAFFRQENVCFKTRLAEIVTDSTDSDILLAAEMFQEEFLSQDRVIRYLSEELELHKKLFERDLYEEAFKKVSWNQKKLRTEFKKEEALFYKVKETFSAYLVDRF